MTAQQRELIHRMLSDAPFDLGGDVETQRPILEEMLAHPLSPDVKTTRGELGGVPVVFIDIQGAEPRGTLFHLHGGGFALGSAESSVGFASEIARRTGMRAVAVEYRLSPEHGFPSAHDDVTAAYRALAERSENGGRIVLSGESAGGNLAVELLVTLREAEAPMPDAALLFSPMTDLTVSGASFIGKADVDPTISAQAIKARVAEYLAGSGVSADDARVSPAVADLHGLPPLLIQAGSHEVLLDDAVRLAAKAASDDVVVILDVTPHVPHVFQAFASMLDEGDSALERVSRFVGDQLSLGSLRG